MTDLTFEEIVQAVHKLTPEQKNALIQSLQHEPIYIPLTREQAIAELETLRAAGVFKNVESLRDKYARPNINVTDAELNDYLRSIGKEWEQELDDIFDDH